MFVTVKLFLLFGHLILCFSWVEQSTNLRSQQNIYTLRFYCVKIWNPWVQVSTIMFIVIKKRNFVPLKLNDFTVFVYKKQKLQQVADIKTTEALALYVAKYTCAFALTTFLMANNNYYTRITGNEECKFYIK